MKERRRIPRKSLRRRRAWRADLADGWSRIRHADTAVLDEDRAIAIERTDGLLEGFFAHAKGITDRLGRAGIAEGQAAAGGRERFEDAIGEGGDALITGLVECEIDFAVVANGADVGGEFFSEGRLVGQVAAIEQPAVRIFHDRFEPEFRFPVDQSLHGLTVAIIGRCAMQMAVETRGGDDAIGARIDKNMGDYPVADAHGCRLFTHGQQQVLAQSPIKKRADARVDACDAKKCEFAGLRVRRLGGGDDAILGVAMNEHFKRFAREGAAWHVAAGQEDFAEVAAVQKDAGRGDAVDAESGNCAETRHEAGKRGGNGGA